MRKKKPKLFKGERQNQKKKRGSRKKKEKGGRKKKEEVEVGDKVF
jgi:hypothetical protein